PHLARSFPGPAERARLGAAAQSVRGPRAVPEEGQPPALDAPAARLGLRRHQPRVVIVADACAWPAPASGRLSRGRRRRPAEPPPAAPAFPTRPEIASAHRRAGAARRRTRGSSPLPPPAGPDAPGAHPASLRPFLPRRRRARSRPPRAAGTLGSG